MNATQEQTSNLQSPEKNSERMVDRNSHTGSAELYFLVKDRESAEKLTQSLDQDDRVSVETIKAFTDLEKDSEHIKGAEKPNVEERTNVKNAARRGAVIGVVLGLLTALMLYSLTALQPHIHVGAITGLAMIGLLLGVWFSTLIGISEPNPRLKAALNEFKKGRVLVLVRAKPKFFGYISSVSRHLLGNRILSQGKL